jgi:hypothetical protein
VSLAGQIIGCPDRMSNLSPGGFKQFRKTIDVSSTRVADHEIAKPALTPCFHAEGQFLRRDIGIIPLTGHLGGFLCSVSGPG